MHLKVMIFEVTLATIILIWGLNIGQRKFPACKTYMWTASYPVAFKAQHLLANFLSSFVPVQFYFTICITCLQVNLESRKAVLLILKL